MRAGRLSQSRIVLMTSLLRLSSRGTADGEEDEKDEDEVEETKEDEKEEDEEGHDDMGKIERIQQSFGLGNPELSRELRSLTSTSIPSSSVSSSSSLFCTVSTVTSVLSLPTKSMPNTNVVWKVMPPVRGYLRLAILREMCGRMCCKY